MAEFLSARVSNIRKSDPCCFIYKFPSDLSDLFCLLKDLVSCVCSGGSFQVDKSNFLSLLRLSHHLENEEILSSLLSMINVESLSVEESLILLEGGLKFGISFVSQLQNLCGSVASHFYEIKDEVLKELDLETLGLLLSNDSLKIEDEDSLYDFIRSRSEDDMRFASLFDFVLFEYLSVDRVENFASFVGEHLLCSVNIGLWSRICRRLVLTPKVCEPNPRSAKPGNANSKHVQREIECVYNGSDALDGIISYLTRVSGGNVHDKGVVSVTASSVEGTRVPKNVADLLADTHFNSRDQPNGWICYEFKERHVTPTSYSIRSYWNSNGPGGCHLKSWVLEGSKDGESWTVLDQRENNSELNDKNVTRNFTISSNLGECFRFIRLRQTGKSHEGKNYIMISSFELFGSLFKD